MLSAARNSLQLVKCVKSNVIKCLMVLGPPLIFLSIRCCNCNCNKYFVTITIQRNLKMEVYLLIFAIAVLLSVNNSFYKLPVMSGDVTITI